MKFSIRAVAATLCYALSSCAAGPRTHDPDHDGSSRATARTSPSVNHATAVSGIPADAGSALPRINGSPRHGEWVVIHPTPTDSIRAWVVYPQRKDKAPVVVVVHEIYGLTPWVRGVADELSANGFIAIAPDLLTMKNLAGFPDSTPPQVATAAIRTLDPKEVQKALDATASFATRLPAASPHYGIIGFCWGGGVSFAHAAHAKSLGASVVYYGVSPGAEALKAIRAPILGLYGENDLRVNATIAPADSVLRTLGRTYEHNIYPGAGHGFLRQQDGMNGANLAAAKQAWPATIEWLKQHLESK